MKKIIYDLGAAKGENIDYYLLKSDLIVCVEANPKNCEEILRKYEKEIKIGKIKIENCVIGIEKDLEKSDFYIHKKNYLLGQFPEPEEHVFNEFEKIIISYKTVDQIFKQYGKAHYIKIDLENYDVKVLEKILSENIPFDYISFEIKNIETLDTFRNFYDSFAFKSVDGHNIKYNYKNHKILTNNNSKKISFHQNAAGPFGNDIDGDWIDLETFKSLMNYKLQFIGWYDVHFSKVDTSNNQLTLENLITKVKKNMRKVKIKKKIDRILKKFRFNI